MSHLRTILSRYPFFLVFIPATFIMHLANYYYSLLDFRLVYRDIVIYALIPVLVYLVLRRKEKWKQKSAVLLFWFLVLFYFFHVLHEFLKNTKALSLLSSYRILLPMLGVAAILLTWYIIRRKRSFERFYYFGNLVFILLFLGGAGEFLYLRATSKVTQHDLADPGKKLASQYIPCDSCVKPDIYYVILDGYTNSKTLAREFHYQNDWITQYLRNKNFFVAENSKSNYYFTQISLASVLNMDYLRRLNTDKLFQTHTFFQSHYTIRENELCRILEKEGYQVNNYSIFDIGDHPTQVTPFLDELTYRSVIGQTFFHKLNRDIGYHLNSLFAKQRMKHVYEKINSNITRMEETFAGVMEIIKSNRKTPQFTYAHFVMPHETFYFDSSGHKNDIAAIVKRGYQPSDYVEQVAFTNRFIVAPIADSLFAHAKRPFILIFQGDHGYRSYPPEKLDLEFENFNAIYFPGGQYELLNDSMTSVNTFRVVLNQFFNQRLPLLKDSSIYLKKRVMMPN